MSIMACAVRIRSFCTAGMCQLIFKADGWTRPSPGISLAQRSPGTLAWQL